jgi:sugar lactone lactonase YvrE
MQLVVATAVLILGFGTPQNARGQNQAQAIALAQMGHTQPSTRLSNSSVVTEATSVPLCLPGGLAFDSVGNLFIADTANNLIREVDLNGIVTTVAGSGEQGFGGDGGAATSALLDSPASVAVDTVGNIYIADTHNQRIREVSSGTIITIAGTGVAGFSGDGAIATSAMLNLPTAIAVDSIGNLYIADTNNNRIREISLGIITTVAGNGEQTYSGDGGLSTAAGLDSPNGVAVDGAFNLYIGDTHNQRVRVVTHATEIISTLVGTGLERIHLGQYGSFRGNGASSRSSGRCLWDSLRG